MTLGFALLLQKGTIWKETLALFKDRTVHQNIALQPTVQAIIPLGIPLDIAGTTPTPHGTLPQQIALPAVIQTPTAPIPVSTQPSAPAPATILPATVPPPAPTVVPSPQLSQADRALLLKKESILEENPEYGNAIQAWEKASVSLADQVVRLEELRQYAFGTDKWVKYFGDIVGAVPPLPDDIYQICNSNDHSKPGQIVKESHVLVLVPQVVMVREKRCVITLDSLGELVKNPKGGGHKTQYEAGFFEARGYENTPVVKSHWALMTKEIIPGSKKKTFANQVEKVKEYSQQANVQYSMPYVIDAVACYFLHFVGSGNRLFDSQGSEDVTYTRCQEKVEKKHPIIVGGFSSRGLFVFDSEHDHTSTEYGVAALRKF